jgi:Flp pilus assembly pilin Flp
MRLNEPNGKAKSMKSSRRPWSEVTAIEYALIASLIAVFIVATFQTVGVHARALF